jgi:tripartite-type tricarboxylate transporter receptor subunit TctC
MRIPRGWLVAFALVFVSAAAAAQAPGAYPSRAVRLIVPYGTGGVSDIMGRVVAQKMSALLGQPMVVQKLNETLAKALAAPDLRERFSAVGADPYPTTPRELADLTRGDVERLAKTITAAGIKPE